MTVTSLECVLSGPIMLDSRPHAKAPDTPGVRGLLRLLAVLVSVAVMMACVLVLVGGLLHDGRLGGC
jgi:hypothetical protein